VSNWKAPAGSGSIRPFHNETHAVSSVYFQTVFAYFADMIKRTFGALPRRHLNPISRESFLQLQQQPAIILSTKVNSITCHFPTANTIIISVELPVLWLIQREVGGW
jgi:hypothetical protein